MTMIPEMLIDRLRGHFVEIRKVYDKDRHGGLAGVWIPEALARKYPKAGESWEWFWVWPSRETSKDPRGGQGDGITCWMRGFSRRCRGRRGRPESTNG